MTAGKDMSFRKLAWKLSDRPLEEGKAGNKNSFPFSFTNFYLLRNKIPI